MLKVVFICENDFAEQSMHQTLLLATDNILCNSQNANGKFLLAVFKGNQSDVISRLAYKNTSSPQDFKTQTRNLS